MGHDLTIYDRSGERKFNLLSRAAVCGVSRASQKTSLLADDTIIISAESARPLNITIGDNIRIFGKRYTFNQLPQPTKNGERSYSYELTLEGLQYDLIDVHYHLPADAYGETYYANLQRHLEVLEWNINRIHPGWTVQVDAYDPDNYQNITTSEKNALAMLQDLCSLFGVEFEITAQGNAGKIHVKKKAGTTHLFTLRYGRGKGLYKLSRTNVNNAGITNRLYVYGSQENLPQNYCHTKLCLADTTRLTSYLEDADSIAAYGVKEGEKNYPDIKAERVGVITAVGDNRITFFDTSGDAADPTNLPMFDLNEKKADGSTKYLIDGTSAKIKFQTGNLAGYEFDLHSYDHATNKFVINRFTDENGLVIPNDTQDAFTFAVGDKYIITDIMLPDSYVQQAQGRLKAKALADFPPMTQPQVSYKVGLTEGFFTAKFGKEVETELLHVGDFIHIIDEEIGVDKEIRITAITRDLLRLHSYELTLSDTVVKTSTVKIINEIKDLQDVISFNSGFADPSKARRRWMATQELLNLVFDPEGDYYSEKIKPLSIETQMLSVGAKSTQFTLQDVVIQPNFNGNPNAISFSAGRLVHYGIDPENTRPWVMGANVFGELPSQAPLYIYAVCPRNGGNGVWQLSTTPIACEAQAAVYFFLVGVLNSVSNDEHGGNPARLISLTYGSSTINGRFVRCGRIESSGGGATYFDLDTGVISGRILFKSSDGSVKDVSALEDRTKELEDYVNNVLPGTFEGINTQIDGKIATFFQEADPAAEWNAATYPAHVGDLWFNTATKELKRFSQAYNWERIEDADAIAAAEAASRAQDTADGKRTVFVTEPKAPYYVGDLWLKGIDSTGKAAGGLWRCIRDNTVTNSFNSNDWVEATYYDCTQVVIDNGIITAGTVQLANEHTGSIVAGITGGYGKTFKETASTPEEEKVRIWAGASESNRRKAPFRVLQNGKVYATNAEIEGKVTATDGSFTGTVNANAGRIGRLVILGNDLAGLDDTGVERVRIGVGTLPSVNTAFSRVGISFSLSSSDGEASWPEDAGGYYTANVIGSGREISTNRDDGNYTDNAHLSATVKFSLSQTAKTVTFGRWCAGYRTTNSSSGTVRAKGTATLYRVVGTTKTKIGSWDFEEQSDDVDFDSLNPGNYEVQVTTYVEFNGEYWFGDVEFWIGGGIWIETAAQSTNITTIAKDGILTMHASDKYLFYSASQGFETRWGNYGLKVDSSGAQTLVNGKWLRIKTT